MPGDKAGQGLVTTRIVRIGKRVPVQRPPLELVVLDHADVRVDGAIPDHAEIVPEVAGADLLEAVGGPGAILGQVVAHHVVQVGRPVIGFQLLAGRSGAAQMPRHPIGVAGAGSPARLAGAE